MKFPIFFPRLFCEIWFLFHDRFPKFQTSFYDHLIEFELFWHTRSNDRCYIFLLPIDKINDIFLWPISKISSFSAISMKFVILFMQSFDIWVFFSVTDEWVWFFFFFLLRLVIFVIFSAISRGISQVLPENFHDCLIC